MKRTFPSIPLDKLNCAHCSRCDGTKCRDWGDLINNATGRKTTPDKTYCVHIWKNFIPEGVNR